MVSTSSRSTAARNKMAKNIIIRALKGQVTKTTRRAKKRVFVSSNRPRRLSTLKAVKMVIGYPAERALKARYILYRSRSSATQSRSSMARKRSRSSRKQVRTSKRRTTLKRRSSTNSNNRRSKSRITSKRSKSRSINRSTHKTKRQPQRNSRSKSRVQSSRKARSQSKTKSRSRSKARSVRRPTCKPCTACVKKLDGDNGPASRLGSLLKTALIGGSSKNGKSKKNKTS